LGDTGGCLNSDIHGRKGDPYARNLTSSRKGKKVRKL